MTPLQLAASWLQFAYMMQRRAYASAIGRPINKTRVRGGRPKGDGETNRNVEDPDLEHIWEVR